MPTRISAKVTSFSLAVLLGVAFSVLAALKTAADSLVPTATELEESLPEGKTLTGREIYELFLRNRNKASFQKLRVISRDPGGSEQNHSFQYKPEGFSR